MNNTTPKQIGDYHKKQIISTLREKGPTSRVELSLLLGISPPAITRNTSQMLENGIIRECGTELSAMGRKPVLIELCDDFAYVLGMDIVGSTIKFALADFTGKVVKYDEEPVRREKDADAVLEQLIAALKRTAAESGISREKIWVATVGTPGIFDSDTGTSRFSTFLEGWDNIDIRQKIHEALDMEVMIENDVTLDVVGESWKGAGKDCDNILYVKLGQGLAARVVLQGSLIRGEHKMAGEIGYMLPGPRENGALNYENLLRNEAVSRKYTGLGGTGKANTISELYALANNGDDIAKAVMCHLLDQFAVVLLNSVTVLDSQIIILGGDACCFAEPEITVLKERMEQNFPLSQNIIISELNRKACLYGAVKTGLDRIDDRIADIW
ncbi:MAG: ROK family transcriptional regulator [Oscillospiraceae bacterium]|nr:ROK family transcriptional regulator [Oscillospiraceae bacterium]